MEIGIALHELQLQWRSDYLIKKDKSCFIFDKSLTLTDGSLIIVKVTTRYENKDPSLKKLFM